MTVPRAGKPDRPPRGDLVVLKVVDGELQRTIPRPGRPKKHLAKKTVAFPIRHAPWKTPPDALALSPVQDSRLNASAGPVRRPRLYVPLDPGAGLGDPFATTAIPRDPHAAQLLHLYIADPFNHKGTEAKRLNFMGDLLCQVRRRSWFPMCRDSRAASACLVTYMAATGGLLVPPGASELSTKKFLIIALNETNKLLSNDNANSDELVLAINFLMLVAQRTGEVHAFEAHSKGLETLLHHRSQHSRRLSQMADTPGQTLPAQERLWASALYPQPSTRRDIVWDLGAKTKQFNQLVDMGLLSRVFAQACSMTLAWARLSAETKSTFDQMMVFFPGQHLWMGIFHAEIMATPFDQLTFSGVRLIAHMIPHPTRGADTHVCPVTKASTLPTLMNSFANLDMNMLVERCPDLVMWICMLAAYWVQDDPTTRSALYSIFEQARGTDASLTAYISKRKELEEKYVWPSMVTQDAWRFWSGKPVPAYDKDNDHRIPCDCPNLFKAGGPSS